MPDLFVIPRLNGLNPPEAPTHAQKLLFGLGIAFGSVLARWTRVMACIISSHIVSLSLVFSLASGVR